MQLSNTYSAADPNSLISWRLARLTLDVKLTYYEPGEERLSCIFSRPSAQKFGPAAGKARTGVYVIGPQARVDPPFSEVPWYLG